MRKGSTLCSEALEIHHLANRDEQLHFALLTDFRDAAEETLPEDAALIDAARAGIEGLNRRYAAGRQRSLLPLPSTATMECGRGRLDGLRAEARKADGVQRALCAARCAECFSEIVGDTAMLPSIKYVITLDTDTQLPRESARQLIGTMAHPLNRPQFDPTREIVTEGYSLLQPRVDVSLPSASRSWFVAAACGRRGD